MCRAVGPGSKSEAKRGSVRHRNVRNQDGLWLHAESGPGDYLGSLSSDVPFVDRTTIRRQSAGGPLGDNGEG